MNNDSFINENFLLETKTAQKLYDGYVANLPIIDYHNHLNPAEIAQNKIFNSISECWLNGDHYKWRAMRANAVPEQFITGNESDENRFQKWAATVPYTMCNPLYHWTHLEMKRYFDIDTLLNEKNGKSIYDRINEKITTKEFSVQNLISKMKVELICTTDEPTDDLEFHKQLQGSKFSKVLPTFRPDKFLVIDKIDFLKNIKKLEEFADTSIENFDNLVDALKKRIAFFDQVGCKLSDHGLNQLFALDASNEELNKILNKRLSNESLSDVEVQKFQTALLIALAKEYATKNWTMQLHLGAQRDNNLRLSNLLGNDVGCDSIGDFRQAAGLSFLLKTLDFNNALPKTILYNLNPADNEVFATMAGNYNDSSIAGKVQWGSAWWFLDQKDGMEKQINTLSNMGLLSKFIGMLTDSRSFMSFPRHEYFRRILCNILGTQIEKGQLPNDIEWIGKMASNISYHNAKNYFKF